MKTTALFFIYIVFPPGHGGLSIFTVDFQSLGYRFHSPFQLPLKSEIDSPTLSNGLDISIIPHLSLSSGSRINLANQSSVVSVTPVPMSP